VTAASRSDSPLVTNPCSRTSRWAALATLAAGALISALAPGAAVASHSVVELVSSGPDATGGELPVYYRGTSADGRRVFLETSERLATTDTDNSVDVYERSGALTTLLSTGPTGGNGPYAASFAGASEDGTRVFFTTQEQLVSGDTDSNQDVYERSGASTARVSTGPDGGNGPFNAIFDGASADATRVFFHTAESIADSDGDSVQDVYERWGGITSRVSTGANGGNGAHAAFFKGVSDSGARVFFQTSEKLQADDTDSEVDVYQRFAGNTTRLSQGPAGGNGSVEEFFDASFVGSSADGTRVFIETDEALVSSDVDIRVDVYERTGGITSLVSVGPAGGNGAYDADFRAISEIDGRVFFHTAEVLSGADLDLSTDVYERSGGTTTLVSTGPLDSPGLLDASFVGASNDGTRVFFSTAISLLVGDTDGGWRDIYERFAGTTTLISTGSFEGGPHNAYFNGSSQDGSRVFFYTPEMLTTTDTDEMNDVYERSAASTTLLSTGAAGGNGAFGASFAGASADGDRVLLQTGESLVATDTDSSLDVYLARLAGTPTGYARPKAATPTRVALVPAYEACTTPNASHGAPLATPSCNPPRQASDYLTVGSPDANGNAASFTGSVTFKAIAGSAATAIDEADVRVTLALSDIRRKNDLLDYSGQLKLNVSARITDRFNGPLEPATVQDLPYTVTVPCTPTADAAIGSSCNIDTTFDALAFNTIRESQRSIWQLGQVELFDGGADGLAATADNTLFAVQGLFTP
jgi:hypothetical protein